MKCLVKSFLLVIFCFSMLVTLAQKDTIITPMDSSQTRVDSTVKKDTLWIKYIPVLPKTFQRADAWFLQMLHTNIADSNIDLLKDYKNYYAQKNTAFKLYFKNEKKSNAGQIIYKIEQRYSKLFKSLYC